MPGKGASDESRPLNYVTARGGAPSKPTTGEPRRVDCLPGIRPHAAEGNPALSPAVIATVLTVIATVLWLFLRHQKERTAQFKQISDRMGFLFYPKGDDAFLENLAGLHLFSQGHSKKVNNLLHGVSGQLGATDQVEVGIFAYRYVTGGGQHSRAVRQTVIAFRSPQLHLPEIALRPQNLFHRIGGVFGYQDIDFDAHPKFSKKYLLRGNDEQKIREVFTHELLAFFETEEGISVEAGGDQLIFYRGGKRIRPEDVRSFMEEGLQVFRLFRR